MSVTGSLLRGWRHVLLIVALGAVPAESVLAKCYRDDLVAPLPDNIFLDISDVVLVTPSMQVGDVIRRVNTGGGGTLPPTRCSSDGGFIYARYSAAAQQVPVPGLSNVYPTQVEGIGVRVFLATSYHLGFVPYDEVVPPGGRILTSLQTFYVELVKTAEATGTGQVFPMGRLFEVYYDGDGPTKAYIRGLYVSSGLAVVSSTCKVEGSSRNIVVDFGSVPRTDFSGVGSRAASRDFDVTLACQGTSYANVQSSVGIRIDATQDASKLSGVLAISKEADSAKGIGIELVRRNGTAEQAVSFGSVIALGRTAPTGNVLTLPLRARYIQTQAGQVTAGKASGVATFTVTYN